MHRRAIVLAALAAGCSNDVAVDLSRIDGPRLLAVAATPAEGAPGASVELGALWVDEHGERSDDALAWSLCVARRALAELGPIADACIDAEPDARVDLGFAPSLAAELPGDACRLFGPDPPPAEAGQPQGRPVDPDHSGGYYQPVLVEVDGELAAYGVRLDCGIAGATQAQAAELRGRHRDNLAPVIDELARIDGDDAQAIAPAEPLEVEAGARVELRVRWPACAATPSCGDAACTLDEDPEACPADCPDGAGCGGAEWYARFDPLALEIDETREAISVAWYATAGELEVARTGRGADDAARTSTNTWTAPEHPGAVTLWIVLRDDRGGVSWRTLDVTVSGG
jgi:hypothetical protein